MRSGSLTALLFASAPAVALAEVMDKQIALPLVAGLVASTFGAGFVTARYKPILLWLVLPAFALLWFGHLGELLDPHVGPAIAREAGSIYVALSWFGAASLLAGPALGLLFRHKASRPET
jgi:hypothetical protein